MIFIQFCKKCGGLMVPKKIGKKTYLICTKCGAKTTKFEKREFKITAPVPKKKEIVVVPKKAQLEAMPKTTIECPKCGHRKAFWWMRQTRAADEPATRFYRCCKCGHTWREYE